MNKYLLLYCHASATLLLHTVEQYFRFNVAVKNWVCARFGPPPGKNHSGVDHKGGGDLQISPINHTSIFLKITEKYHKLSFSEEIDPSKSTHETIH